MNKSLTIVITTCLKRTDTIELSTNSLIKSIENYPNIKVMASWDYGDLGCFSNYNKALRQAIRNKTTHVLILPDDMVYNENWVELFMNNDIKGYLALYVPKGLGERFSMKQGFNTIDGGWASSWGGCYLMETETAKKVVENDFYISHLNGTLDGSSLHNYEWNKRIDHCIPEVFKRLNLPQLYYVPSQCTHKGYNSTIGNTHTENEDAYE